MSKIIQIALKDIRLQFSQRSQWLFFFILPIIFIAIFGGSFSGGSSASGIAILVTDLDQSELSAELLDTLITSETVTPETLALSEAEARFADNDAVALLVIPAGFGATVETGSTVELDLRLQPNNSNGLLVGQALQNAISQLSRSLTVASSVAEAVAGDDAAEKAHLFATAKAAAETALATAPAQIIKTQPADSAESSFDVASQMVAGQLITWVFIPMLGTAVLFTSERTRGTLRRIMTTATSKTTYILGTIAGQLFLGLLQLTILVTFGTVVFGLNFANDLLALGLLFFTFTLSAVALGTALGTITKSDGQASGVSVMFGMLGALLGGCWFPYEFFSPAAKQVANFMPTSWALRGLLDLSSGATLVDILPNAGVLMLFAVVFFTIGVWRFRFE